MLAARRAFAAVALLALAPWTGAAQAEGATPETPEDDRPRLLDGYFLRVGLGMSAVRNHVELAYTDFADNAEGTSTGLGMAVDLTLSAPISASWTLGGGAWTSFVLGARSIDASEAVPAELQSAASLTVVGVVAQWYFARRLGLHADTGLGVAVFQTERRGAGGPDAEISPLLGPGLSLGVGGDLWTDEHTGFGAVVRFTAAIAQNGRRGAVYQHVVIAPSLLLTACING